MNGFIGKHSKFVNSSLSSQFNLYVLQESNVTADHFGYDDWSKAGMSCLNLSMVNSESYKRGMLLGWSPHVQVSKITPAVPCPFEIAVAKVFSGHDSFNIISAYRSPSMNPDEMLLYFDVLDEILTSSCAKTLLMGDLNISAERPLRGGMKQKCLLDRIRSQGFKSLLSAPTHDSTQLDYVFANFENVVIFSKKVGIFDF